MKRCPKCQKSYDDKLNYCLEDGTNLVGVVASSNEDDEVPTQYGRNYPTVASDDLTQNLPNEQSNPIYFDIGDQKSPFSNPAPPTSDAVAPQQYRVNYVLLALLFLLVGVIGGGGFVLFLNNSPAKEIPANRNAETDSANANVETAVEKETPSKTEKPTPVPTSNPKENSNENSLDSNSNKAVNLNADKMEEEEKGCFLHDGGKGGGEVRVRRNCDRLDCSTDDRTIAGKFSNGTSIEKVGGAVRSGNFTWIKVNIGGDLLWVATSKIRCR